MTRRLFRRNRFTPTLIAFVVGVLLGVSARVGAAGLTNQPPAAPSARANEAAPPSIDGVETTHEADLAPASDSPAGHVDTQPEYLARLDALARLNQNLQQRFYVGLLLGEELNDDFAQLYALSNSEIATLRNAIDATRNQVAALEARNARIEKRGEGEFSITIPDAPVEGGAIYDEFMRTIRKVLGTHRIQYAETLSAFNFESSTVFHKFGLARLEIRITPMRTEDGTPTGGTTITPDRGDGVMLQTTEIAPEDFPKQFPALYRRMVEDGFVPAPP